MDDMVLIKSQIFHTFSPDLPGVWVSGLLFSPSKGVILETGSWECLKANNPQAVLLDLEKAVIVPGFIDTHTHFPQLDMMGRCGKTLLDWLETYTFPEEAKFSNPYHATHTSVRFVRSMIACGSVCGVFFASSSPVSAHALFQTCEQERFTAIIGKVSMDHMAPPDLCVDIQTDMETSKELIEAWHKKTKYLYYALTPRFALSCSQEMLKKLIHLKELYPDLYIQTHLSETMAEVALTCKTFNSPSYASIYHNYGYLTDQTILAHGIYITPDEQALLLKQKCILSHCPTSNLFLGSGLMPLRHFAQQHMRLSLGSDVAGGTTLNLWSVMGEAYKVGMLRGEPVNPEFLFYLATLGGAKGLSLDAYLGNFAPGKDASFQVLYPHKHPLLTHTWDLNNKTVSTADKLLALMCAGITPESVWIKGKQRIKTEHPS